MSFDVRCQMFNDNGYTIDKKGDIMICQSAQCPHVFCIPGQDLERQ